MARGSFTSMAFRRTRKLAAWVMAILVIAGLIVGIVAGLVYLDSQGVLSTSTGIVAATLPPIHQP